MQQLGIVVIIDVNAALIENTLENNIYLFDNNRWLGSNNEGTDNLISAIYHIGNSSQVMNWMIAPISGIPITVPKTFFNDKEQYYSDKKTSKVLDIYGKEMDLKNSNKLLSSSQTKQVNEEIQAPMPRLIDIKGEAVENGIMIPAIYGSPDLNSKGEYWSAVVNETKDGKYSYTLYFQIFYPCIDQHTKQVEWKYKILSHDAYIYIAKGTLTNGFCGNDHIRPAY